MKAEPQLLNAVAHELSTPLTPIRLHLLFIEERMQDLDEDLQESFITIQRNVDRLHSLIKDVIQIGALDSGRFPVRVNAIDLAATVNEVCREYRRAAVAAGVQIDEDLPKELTLEADRERIVQVMHHLLRNAIRCTGKGGTIHVHMRRQGPWAEVLVEDNGIGFDPTVRDRIFEPFSTAMPEMPDSHEHAGLGLYISRGIIELHKGQIWARSRGPGQGATFGFKIPARETRYRREATRVEEATTFSQRIRSLV